MCHGLCSGKAKPLPHSIESTCSLFLSQKILTMGYAGAGSSVREVGRYAGAAAAGGQAGTQDNGAPATGRLSDGGVAAAAAAGAALGRQATLCGRQAPLLETQFALLPPHWRVFGIHNPLFTTASRVGARNSV